MNEPPIDERISNLPVLPARNTDPATSHIAAQGGRKSRGTQRIKVYNYFGECKGQGSTDYEMKLVLHFTESSARKRRQELRDDGLIIDSGRRRPTNTGYPAIVWVLAEYADENSKLGRKPKLGRCPGCGLLFDMSEATSS